MATTTFSLSLIVVCTMMVMISVSLLLFSAPMNPFESLNDDTSPLQATKDLHRWTIQTLEKPSQVEEDEKNLATPTIRKPSEVKEDVKNLQAREPIPESGDVGRDVQEDQIILRQQESEQTDEQSIPTTNVTKTPQKLGPIGQDIRQNQKRINKSIRNQTAPIVPKRAPNDSTIQNRVNGKQDKAVGSVRRKNKPKMEAKKRTEFMLVTGERSKQCKTSKGSYVMMMSYKNKIDYCNTHGCKVWYALEVWEPGYVGTWVRYPLLLKLMKTNPTIKWFMWMDSDAIFTDFNFSIPIDTYEKQGKNLVIPGDPDKVYAANPDWISLNAGIFLIRNCEWSRNFLLKWKQYGDPSKSSSVKEKLNSLLKRPKDWDADDQSALVHLLNLDKINSKTYVHLEGGYTLHGYWKFIVDRYEEITEKRQQPPFVTHFCGCNFCGRQNLDSECYEGFWRAYNFADNQLLSRVSLSHSALASADPLLVDAGRKSQ